MSQMSSKAALEMSKNCPQIQEIKKWNKSDEICIMQDFFYLHDFDSSFSVQIHKMDDTSIGR